MTAPVSAAGTVSVALPIPVRQTFTYTVPPALEERIVVGAQVRVPLGSRRVVGTVVDSPSDAPPGDLQMRSVEAVLSDTWQVPPAVLELTRFVSEYYLCSWGEAIEAALPPRVSKLSPKGIRRLPAADAARLSARATQQRRLLERLPEDGTPVALGRLEPARRRAIRPLVDRGWAELIELRDDDRVALRPEPPLEEPPAPTPGQRAVLEQVQPALASGGYRPFLLYGATGSGKTEVYFRAAQAALEQGRSVLYLVPEIGLTPLLLSKVARRFPGQAAVLHSGLSRRRRFEAWEGLRTGRRRFAVGTRSAVFAPLDDLGLIVVDEEQDGSYKQGENPRYNARDLAVVRAKSADAVLLLGSATPSMESFHHARLGRYSLLRLGERILKRPLPAVEVVDMREVYRESGQITPVSPPLVEALRRCVERGEQALVLRNRRGWSTALLCPRCGERVCCEHCSVSMTWHKAESRLRCHTCARERGYPDACPTCGAEELQRLGEGTEKLEQIIRDAVPGARVDRMDRDTVRRRGAHESMLRRFDSGKIDVLVGTQMIAKGHDFPRVTLVGVISADQALGLADFRAGERTFQLLTQVAGRAGRGTRPGLVIVQAFDPDHPVIKLAATQDYEAYYDREMEYRRALRYPPLSAMVRILVQDRNEFRAREWIGELARALRDGSAARVLISGPGPAPVSRARGRHRQQLLVRTAGRRRLVRLVDQSLRAVEGRVPGRAIQVDVDVQSLL